MHIFFARLASASVNTFWEISVSISDGILLTRTSVTGQQNINIQTQIKYKVIVSQVSVVMSQVAHRKGWKRGFARGQVASGKWFLQESLLIPNFLKCFKNNFFFQETSSFWLLENAKNPTDLKPYWSRAGLRHPYICLFWITICCRWFVYFYIYVCLKYQWICPTSNWWQTSGSTNSGQIHTLQLGEVLCAKLPVGPASQLPGARAHAAPEVPSWVIGLADDFLESLAVPCCTYNGYVEAIWGYHLPSWGSISLASNENFSMRDEAAWWSQHMAGDQFHRPDAKNVTGSQRVLALCFVRLETPGTVPSDFR